MASIGEYQRDIQRYQVLKDKLETIVFRLNTAADAAGSVAFEVGSSCKIDGEISVVTKQTNDLKNEIVGTVNHLRSVVIPSIDGSINDARRQIAFLEEQERRRREEENG